jgi:hypothetical protein
VSAQQGRADPDQRIDSAAQIGQSVVNIVHKPRVRYGANNTALSQIGERSHHPQRVATLRRWPRVVAHSHPTPAEAGERPVGALRAAQLLAALSWCALCLQLGLLWRQSLAAGAGLAQALVAFLGYFTILTNALVAVVATAGARRAGPKWLAPWYRPQRVGCATTAILLVGLAYHLLLRQLWSPRGAQWLADVSLHYAVPLVSVAHWLCYGERDRLPPWAPLLWCLYPASYFAYLLLRGAVLHAYPYPFLDVPQLGLLAVLRNALGLLGAFAVLGYLVWSVGRLRGRARPPAR